DKDEYDARLESALSARTYADLDHVVSDLPGARVPPVRRVTATNGLAVASLACGLAQFAFGPLPTIPAIVLGHVARHQIKRTGEQGGGMALAGLLLGWAAVALGIIAILGMAVFVVSSAGPPRPPPRSALLVPLGGHPARAGPPPPPRRDQRCLSGWVDSAAMKASYKTSTRPITFIRRLPSFCFSSSLHLQIISPP